MEVDLLNLCAEHRLTNISVMLQAECRGRVSVYVHWRDSDGDRCASGAAYTFDEALSEALGELDTLRSEAARLCVEGLSHDASAEVPAIGRAA